MLSKFLQLSSQNAVETVDTDINAETIQQSLTLASTYVISDSDVNDISPTTKDAFVRYVEGGGRLVVLAGTKALNQIFGWNLEQRSDPDRSYRNSGCSEFDGIDSVESIRTGSHLVMRTVPDSAVSAFTCKVRCDTYGAVVRFDMGRGHIYYLGWDFSSSLEVKGSKWGEVMTRIVKQFKK